MGLKKLSIEYEDVKSIESLRPDRKELVLRALEAAKDAYAPYSNFNVGAAVLLENGEIISANNQENAAYPSGLCAERVAIFYAGSKFPGTKVTALAVAAVQNDMPLSKPVSPCGSCRQVMHETERRYDHPMEVILYGTDQIRIIRSAADLLPLPFSFERLV